MQKGIDISVWQGPNIDFNAVKNAGYDFVIIRAGYGKYEHQKDPYFEQNYKNAKSAGARNTRWTRRCSWHGRSSCKERNS